MVLLSIFNQGSFVPTAHAFAQGTLGTLKMEPLYEVCI